MSLTSMLYRAARTSAWVSAASRGPKALGKRARNRVLFSKLFNKLTRF